MLTLWNKHHPKMKGRPFGSPATYLIVRDWLAGHGLVEDWGCGCAYAKQYFPEYRGVDGSGDDCDQIADLTSYRSNVPCILLRHVLEHNINWRSVLCSALDSFQKRMAVVLHMKPHDMEENVWMMDGLIPHIHLPKAEFEIMLRPYLRDTVEREGEVCYLLEKECLS